jgi:hypothetical protein
MKRIAPWLLPTFIGPVIGACSYVFLIAQGSAVPWLAWLVVAGIASGLSMIVAVLMALTDVTLLKLAMRQPPTGWRAWAMGIAAPVPVLWCWQKLLKLALGALPALPVLWQMVLAFILPMLIVAIGMRLVLGTRPDNWKG